MFIGLEVFHEEAVLVIAEQIATHGRWVEVSGVEIDKGLIQPIHRYLVDVFSVGAGKGTVDVRVAQQETTHRAIAGQLCPACGLVDIFTHR